MVCVYIYGNPYMNDLSLQYHIIYIMYGIHIYIYHVYIYTYHGEIPTKSVCMMMYGRYNISYVNAS